MRQRCQSGISSTAIALLATSASVAVGHWAVQAGYTPIPLAAVRFATAGSGWEVGGLSPTPKQTEGDTSVAVSGPDAGEAARSRVASVSEFDARADSAAVRGKEAVPRLRYSIGSTFFVLGNLLPGDPPYFFLLNFRYELAKRDVLFVEAITWTYYEPLGTYGSSGKHYPGKVRAFGVGAGYQRFVWKNLYATAQATPFLQQFLEADNTRIQNGFQLYLQSRIGYRFEFFKRRWFLEPSAAFNYWPINTNFPASFREVEEGTPNYYLLEPGLHFGFRY